MKSFASIALLGAALVAAAPLNEKRNVVWHTQWSEVTETVLTTSTKWVSPGSEPTVAVAAAAANPGGDFHETAAQYSAHQPQYTPEASESSVPSSTEASYETPAAPAITSTDEAPAPEVTTSNTPPPPPAPTTPTTTYVAPTPTPTYVAPSPSTTQADVAPTSATSEYVAPTPSSTYVAPAPSTATTVSASSSDSASYSNVQMTYYTPGLGSCGITSTDSDAIVAVAAGTMAQGYGGNPNNNPLCGKTISITANGVTKSATIVDTCPGCVGPADLDLSPSLFSDFASESVGRISGASWTLS